MSSPSAGPEHAPAPEPREVFSALIGRIGEGRWHDLGVLYAEDVVVLNPFAPDAPTRSEGREAVERFYRWLSTQVSVLRVEDVVVHETTDPEVIVAEGRNVGTSIDGTRFERPVVFVLRVRDGLIVESRDYLGPRRALPAR